MLNLSIYLITIGALEHLVFIYSTFIMFSHLWFPWYQSIVDCVGRVGEYRYLLLISVLRSLLQVEGRLVSGWYVMKVYLCLTWLIFNLVTLYSPISLSRISHLCSGRSNTVSLMVSRCSKLFGTRAGYMLSGVWDEWLWFNEEWDNRVAVDVPRQWNQLNFAFLRWDHATIFTNLVQS